jgi:hypothetical protein
MPEDTVHSPWKEWRRKWRDPITLFTLLLVIVGALQWCTLQNTDETLRLQQRAWLSPTGAKLFGIPTKDEAINFRLALVNSGREPASGVYTKTLNATIDGTNTKLVNLYDVEVKENTSCEGLKPRPDYAVIAPTGANTQIEQLLSSESGDPRMVADDKILSGDKFFYVRGCLAYLTQGKERHSSFCYILASVPSAPSPRAPSGRAFEFVLCRSGFTAD